MEELLKEVTLSERRKRQIDAFIQTVTKLLQTIPDTPKVEVGIQVNSSSQIHMTPVATTFFFNNILLRIQVSDLSWLSGAVKVPFLLVPKTAKGKFHMTPPASVDLIGSYPLGTCIKPRILVDLAVTIPAVSHLFLYLNTLFEALTAVVKCSMQYDKRKTDDC